MQKSSHNLDMLTLKPWYVLDIDVADAISAGGHEIIQQWKDSVPAGMPGGYWKLYQDTGLDEFFTSSFLEHMANKGIPVDMMVSFYRKSHYCHPTAHIDGSLTRTVVFALNWVLDSQQDTSEMIWYEMPNTDIPVVTTEYGTAQVDIDTTDLAEIGRRCIGNQLTLVRVNTPHNIMVGANERFVVSVRCKMHDVHSWEDAVEFFKPMIIQ
jgi:hypothetical protein